MSLRSHLSRPVEDDEWAKTPPELMAAAQAAYKEYQAAHKAAMADKNLYQKRSEALGRMQDILNEIRKLITSSPVGSKDPIMESLDERDSTSIVPWKYRD